MYCLNGVLYQLKHSDTAPPTTPTSTTTTTTTTQPSYSAINGTITALTGSSITVTGGDSPTASLTCTLGTGTPSTAGFAIGDSVRMYCLTGALYQLRLNTTTPTTSTTTTTTTTTTTQQNYSAISGTITVLTDGSITVAGGDSPTATLTCSLGAGTPSTAGFAIGDSVRMYCLTGALYRVRLNTTSPTTSTTTTTTTTTTTAQPNYSAVTGTITALSASSISVNGTGEGDSPMSLNCSVGVGTPGTSGFAVGDSVRMYCLNGALYELRLNTTASTTSATTTTTTTTTTTNPSYSYVSGTIQALSSSSITVGSGDASKTCSIGPSSPSTSGFSVGNSVGMYCATSDGSRCTTWRHR